MEGLPLSTATGADWAALAIEQLDFLLADHAHCEQKAASAALGMLGRFPQQREMVRPMMALAHEELHHLRQVLDVIERRGGTLTRPAPDFYVRGLRQELFRTADGLGPYGDLLIVNAFVEARSCERFRRLSEALAAAEFVGVTELSQFYLTLAGAEGRHWELFRDLAVAACGEQRVAARIQQAARLEDQLFRSRPLVPRMH